MVSHKEKTFDQRVADSTRILTKYPDRVCVYIERDPLCKILPDIDRNKYLVPSTITVAEFIYIIRGKMTIQKSDALFFYTNRVLISGNTLMSEINEKHKSLDGFLYILYKGENCFG